MKSMNMKHAYLPGLALLLPLLAHAAPDAANKDEVVARMGAVELKASDVRRIIDLVPDQLQDRVTPQSVDRFVRIEITRRALLDEARKQGFDKRNEVKIAMERAQEQAVVQSYINSIARPPAGFPSETELKAAYEQFKSRMLSPRQYGVSQIFFSSAVGGDAKARSEAERVSKETRRKGADFAELAKKYSDHKDSGAKGGDMGLLAEDKLLPEMRAALEGMKKGEIGDPIKTANGYHILRLNEVKEPAPMPLDQVKDRLRATLRSQKAKQIEAAYLDAMVAKSPITVNEIAVGELAKEK
jgi:peptidylprolyl isomerase